MGQASNFKHLFSEGRIGTMKIRNRICMAPMGSNFGEPDGSISERLKRYYEARAKGGAGIIIVETTAVNHPAGVCTPYQTGISRDEYLPGLTELTERIHRHGAKAAIQLQHAGKVAVMDIAVGRALWVPSEPSLAMDGMPDLTPEETQMMMKTMTSSAKLHYHVMIKDDIVQLVESFADAADRAKRAGFDAVEIHAGHGYLISSFLSPAVNKRTDEYGGSPESRARLMIEVIQAIKKKVGQDFPLWLRIDAKEFRIENGITLVDSCKTAKLAEDAGADAIHVSAYANPALGHAFTEAPLVHKVAGYLTFAEEIKKNVSIPIIAVGRIEPEEGDRIIGEGKADFIAMGRKLIADPELPNKLISGRMEEIRPCIYCYTCVGQIFLNESIHCAVNASAGKEADFDIIPAKAPKNVLIIGGGPAGMEAARVASFRGHNVTLCEKQEWLGGTTFLSALVNPENGQLIDYLSNQVNILPIDVELGKEVTLEYIEKQDPDVILIAQGAKRDLPQISGIDGRNIFSGDDLRDLLLGGDGSSKKKFSFLQRAILRCGGLVGATKDPNVVRKLSNIWMPLGDRVVIIGGSLVGIELAEFLTERGRHVTVMEESDCMAIHMSLPRRWRVLHALRESGVLLIVNAKVEAIEKKEVVYLTNEGNREAAKYDSVIIAMGAVPNRELSHRLSGMDFEVHLIGDCNEINYIMGAMADGARLGREI